MALNVTTTAAQRDTAFTKFFTVVATFVGCAVVLLAVPRPALPNSLPALSLDAQLVREAEALDAAQAARAPENVQVSTELEALYLEDGLDDVRGVASQNASRRRLMQQRAAQLSADDRDSLRAKTTTRALHCLATSRCAAPEHDGLLGAFPALTLRYGLRDIEGQLLAPALSLRAAYKVRWNMVHARPNDEGLSRAERQAFFGFLALHARSLPLPERASAAQAFYNVGGQRSGEAYAVFLFQGGRPEEALTVMQRALSQRDELRLRNMTLGMQLALHAQREPEAEPE